MFNTIRNYFERLREKRAYSQAITRLDEYVETGKTKYQALAWAKLGHLNTRQNRPEEALNCYKKATAIAVKERMPTHTIAKYESLVKLSSHLVYMAKKLAKKQEEERQAEKGALEQTLSACLAILGIFLGLIFLSSSITGSTILNLNKSASNLIALWLLAAGLSGLFLYIKRKRQKRNSI